MATTIYQRANDAAGLAVTMIQGPREQLAGARADLAQLDEWLRVCEERRLDNEETLLPAVCMEIAASSVAPEYLQAAALRKGLAIGPVQAAIFDAEGEVMEIINRIQGNVLWMTDEPDPEDRLTITNPRLPL